MQRGKIEKLKGIVDVADATPRLLKDAVRPSFEKNEDLEPNSYRMSLKERSDKGTLDRQRTSSQPNRDSTIDKEV